jgi:hypothetical protein
MDAVAAANPEGFGIDYSKNVPTPTEMPDQILGGFQLPTMGRDAASPMFEGGREMVVEAPTENMLNRQYPMAVEGQNYPGPNGAMFTKRGGRWVKSYGNPSIGGLNQRPFDVGNVRPDLTDVLDKTGGMLSNTSNYAKFW